MVGGRNVAILRDIVSTRCGRGQIMLSLRTFATHTHTRAHTHTHTTTYTHKHTHTHIYTSAHAHTTTNTHNHTHTHTHNHTHTRTHTHAHTHILSHVCESRTSSLEEKATACNMLCCYADELKEGFMPYVKPVRARVCMYVCVLESVCMRVYA